MAKKKKKFKKLRRKIRYNVIYVGILIMIFISNLMPRKLWLRLCGGGLGRVTYYLATRSRALASRHLTMAFKSEKSPAEIKKLTKDVFRMLGMNAGDLIRAYRIDRYEN